MFKIHVLTSAAFHVDKVKTPVVETNELTKLVLSVPVEASINDTLLAQYVCPDASPQFKLIESYNVIVVVTADPSSIRLNEVGLTDCT